MSFITVEHSNKGAVTNRMQNLANVQKNNMVIKTINDKLDDLYQLIFKATPVKTGYMRSTLKVSTGDGFAQIAVTAYYAKYVEFGTKRNSRQPFFFPNITAFSVQMIISVRQLYMTMR